MNRIDKLPDKEGGYAFVLVNEKDQILEWEFVKNEASKQSRKKS